MADFCECNFSNGRQECEVLRQNKKTVIVRAAGQQIKRLQSRGVGTDLFGKRFSYGKQLFNLWRKPAAVKRHIKKHNVVFLHEKGA